MSSEKERDKYLEKVFHYLEKLKKTLPKDDKNVDISKKSDEAKTNGQEKNNLKSEKKLPPIAKLENAILDLEKMYNEILWKLTTADADKVNLKNKLEKEKIDIIKYDGAKLSVKLLQPYDMLKKVVLTPNQNPEVQNYLKGFEMLINQMESAFESAGVTAIKIKVGDDFDQNQHEAIETVETEAYASGKITQIVSNGYMLKDKVIMFAKVKVAK